ncbi:hypothetical protein SteCoe_11277 [Stentor coeruleus]|uniref:Uncharacterized protein n=1 Tax=Stentor coeruleus TaxID=5963 RepID=A0A1R2CDJ5_9CILI|nr:hypothetical protein SteCoe_11277 [Stentor coeruleus]
MDYSLQRERTRINNILSKLLSNLAPPALIVKKSTYKLKKHKKLFTYEAESTKDLGATDAALSILIEKDREKARKEKKNSDPALTVQTRQSIQQVFTFQTLREALAMNPDLNKTINYSNKSAGRNFDNPLLKNIKIVTSSVDSEHNKKFKYLPRLKGTKSILKNQTPTFLKIVSRNTLAKRFLETQNLQSKSPEIEYNQNMSNCDYVIKSKQDSYCDKDVSVELKQRNMRIKYKKMSLGPMSRKKISNVGLPKSVRNVVFNDNKSNLESRVLEEDMTLKGWEKTSTLNLLDN